MSIIRVGHVFVGLVFLRDLLVSERQLNNISLPSRHLTSWCNQGAYFRPETLPSADEIGVYNIARVLTLYNSYWAAINNFFIYARPCINKGFFSWWRVQLCFSSLFLSTQKSTAMMKNFLEFFLKLSFVPATQTNSKSGEDVSQIIIKPEWFIKKSAVKTDI